MTRIAFLFTILFSGLVRADNWQHIQMLSQDGTQIRVDYVRGYQSHGDLAKPIWLNIINNNFQENDMVQVSLLNYCDSRSDQPSFEYKLTMDYAAGKRFTGQFSGGVLINVRQLSYYSICRQELIIKKNGENLKTESNHINFPFSLNQGN